MPRIAFRLSIRLLCLLMALCLLGASPESATTAPATRSVAASLPPATTRFASVSSVGEVERIYKAKLDVAKLHYQQSITAAREERIHGLKSLQDKALAARDTDRVLQLRDLITAAEAEAQSNAGAGDPLADKQRAPVALRIVGKIDGRGVLTIRQDGASWHQTELDAPEVVTLNGVALYPNRPDSLHNTGATKFLPMPVNLRTGALVKKTARNMIEAQAGDDEFRIAFNDTDPGAGHYDLTVEFQPLSGPPAKK